MLKRIERANVEPLIQGFLDTRFKGATKGERDFILEQIHKEVKAPDGVYDFCLFDMVQGGLRGVRKKYRRRYLRYFYQHVWAAIKGVLKILIALMIFANLQGSFQIIVVSLLITLYVYIRRSSASIWLFTASGNQAGYLRFLALKDAAGLEPTSEEWAASFTLQEENRKAIIRHYVNDVCHSILIVIVGWNLFKAL